MKRREFIQNTSFAAVTLLSIPTFMNAARRNNSIGLQLYTLKDIIHSDVKGVLGKVAEYGYKELETYGYKDGMLFGMTLSEFSQFTKGLGMNVVSGHYGMDVVRGNWEKAVADAKATGQEYMVVPWLSEQDRTHEAIKGVCEEINKAGEVCKKYGIRMGYHNHAFEFKEKDGKILYDVMLAELDPSYVGMQMDLYWVVYAGFDPLKYFEKYPGRFESWHVKDMDKEESSHNADVGTGVIDFKAIFAKAKQSGMKHFYIEQEYFKGSPLDSIRVGITNLKAIV